MVSKAITHKNRFSAMTEYAVQFTCGFQLQQSKDMRQAEVSYPSVMSVSIAIHITRHLDSLGFDNISQAAAVSLFASCWALLGRSTTIPSTRGLMASTMLSV